jgi:methyl-accepting chemotaxis protein
MAFGRETVGTAYVRILADGSRLDEDIKRQMKDHGATMSKVGEEGAEGYEEGWQKHWRSSATQKEMSDGIKDALARNDGVDRFLRSAKWEQTKKLLNKKFGEAGDVAGANMARRLIESGDFDEFNAKWQRLVPEIAHATDQIMRKEDEFAKKFRADMDAIGRAAERSLRGANQELVKQARLHEDIFKTIRTGQLDLIREAGKTESFLARLRRGNEDATTSIRTRWTRVSDAIGTAFGRGSRNDFLNFFGSLFRNLSRLPILIGDAVQGIGKFLGDLSKTFQDAGGWGEGLIAVLGKVGPGAAGGAIGLGALIILLGSLTSAASLAAGTITALVSSLAFGLAGALIPLAPLIFPLITGIAGLAFAVSALNKETKKSALHPIAEGFKELKGLGKDVLGGMEEGIGPAAGRIVKAMEPLHDLFHDIGVAFGDLATRFVNLMDKPGPQRFVETFSTFIPDAIHDIGRILLNLTRAFSNLFAAAVPSSRDFLGWLIKITREFREWVAANPGKVADFIDNAVESAKTLGGFLGGVSDLLFTIIGAGRSAGDSMFSGLTDTIEGWVRTLQENPEILQNWFDDARKFAGAVGDVVVALGHLFDALDNFATRTIVTGAFGQLTFGLEALSGAIKLGMAPLEGLFGLFRDGSDEVKKTNFQLLKTEGYKTAAKAADDLASSISGVAWAYGEASRAAVQNQLESATGQLGQAVGTLQGAGVAIGTMTDAARGNADAIDRVTTAFDKQQAKIRENIEVARGLADGFTEVQDAQGNWIKTPVPPDKLEKAKEDLAKYTDQMDESVSQQETFNRFIGKTGKALDEQSKKVRKVADDLGITVKAFRKFPSEVRSEFLTNIPQTAEAALRMIDHFKALQKFKNIKATISLPGVDLTLKQIKELADKYKLTPRQVKTLVELEGVEVVKGDYRALQKEGDDFAKSNPHTKVTADKSQADSAFHDVTNQANVLNGAISTIKILADDAAAMAALAEADRQRRALDGSVATIHVHTVRGTGGQTVQGPTAAGGVFSGWQRRIIGEAGPEAVVPLDRPLHLVDPAVRELSAIAQGMTRTARGVVVASAKPTIDASGWQIITPTEDPAAVAQEVINRLVAVGY